MAGHSKWANIQHRKGRVDAARGKLWSKLSKGIIIAAQSGGGDPSSNFKLRKAIDDAKAVSMPKDNIERAIKRGTGELDGGRVEEIVYEGYGPGGVAIMCESLTDNRNRTAPELRSIFSKLGGELGKTGCVSYLFDRKGLFVFDASTVDEDQVTEVALENGGEDVESTDDGKLQVTTSPDDYQSLAEAFEAAELVPEMKEISLIPQTTVEVDVETGKKVMRLLEQLDDHDDIQNVSTNLNITDDLLAED
ncbi:YebC/PmpR family DNA-binding transcriptional regulator [Rhodopirellula sp. MGV]|uniref:YebC/PmpR family DNA-binding transcriptional regulator n=1 Tax=Rhodopirellula sp. MGV TaxID=2023130 RepID=UPI000B961422|nr:YebC/PmpR family DNA-binding transcriptional regulator [Rhodopirellula sp. MGV]OYP35703.1 YebC/PmpR family DNA-binding transcriptional regulator [Rhodopirellula sp. MGV]PNY34999.1 YebC/PmpR family DNA-binding transcriptional regulator [Rhodopirellula baltica]